MKLSILLCLCLLAQGVFPHMPTVYEFCSHVVANREVGRATCDASQCQGRPGKIGPVGPRGIQGLKGQQGEQSAKIGPVGPRGIQGLKGQRGETGTSERVEEKVRLLEGSFQLLIGGIANSLSTSTKETMCYMGMKSGQIPDTAVTSSSDASVNNAAHLGRLDNQPSGSKFGIWSAGMNQVGEWIQVDLGQPEVVAGVVTQGRPVHGQWVTSYKVSCGNVVNSTTTITENGRAKVFSANTNRDTKVVNKFPQLMTCRYIRIYPQTYNGWTSMRLEIIRGICKDIY